MQQMPLARAERPAPRARPYRDTVGILNPGDEVNETALPRSAASFHSPDGDDSSVADTRGNRQRVSGDVSSLQRRHEGPPQTFLTTRNVAKYHSAHLDLGTSNRAEVYLLHFDEAPKWTNVTDRRRNAVAREPVLSCLFGDATATIDTLLRRKQVNAMLPLFKQSTAWFFIQAISISIFL